MSNRIIGILLCIPLLFWVGARVYKEVVFSIECEGRLKRAAHANTVELAREEIQIAKKYMVSHNLTSGYTSILYNTPDEDVGFWYRNISEALQELDQVKGRASQLEKSNLLMKLRETLLDQGEKGVKVTIPDGIAVFPHNFSYMVTGWLSSLLLCLGLLVFAAARFD